MQFQGGTAEARELLGNIDLHRREVTKLLCQKWHRNSWVRQGEELLRKASNGHDILKNSSIRHSWAEKNRVIICSWVSPEIIWKWSRDCTGETLLRFIAKILRWPISLRYSAANPCWIPPAHTECCADNLRLLRDWEDFPRNIKAIINLFLYHDLEVDLSRGLTLPSLCYHTHICRILTPGSLSSTPPNPSQLPSPISSFHSARSSNPALLANNTKKLSPAKACASSLLFCTFPHKSQYRKSVQKEQ